MTLGQTIRRERIQANGTELYTEVRGSGPSVLFIAGGSGDAENFSAVAEGLADEFTTITYDRRGNSRSPVPDGWTKTSMAEQADDAAALLRSLGAAPAAVFGTSLGGAAAIDLVVRHPEILRGAVSHEPGIVSVLPYKDEVMAQLKGVIDAGFAKSGPRGAMETFLRVLSSDAVVDALEPAHRERTLGNANTFFAVELPALAAYEPDAAALARSRVPLRAMHGDETFPWLVDTTKWLAAKANAPIAVVSGNHVAYLQRPVETTKALRTMLRSF